MTLPLKRTVVDAIRPGAVTCRPMSRQLLFAVAVAAWAAGALPCLIAPASAQQPSATPAQGTLPRAGAPAPVPATPAAPSTPPTAAAPAAPAPPSVPPTQEAKERARVAYARGQAAFSGGDYTQALRAFEEAFAAVPNPIVLLSVSESAAKLGKVDVAIAALDQYLTLRPDAPDRPDVTQKRAALAMLPAHVYLTSEPAGADIVVDGQLTGKKTPAELELSPGSHELQAALPGHESNPTAMTLKPGTRAEQALDLHAPPPPPAAAVPPPAVALEAPTAPIAEVPTTALWVTGTIGAAGLIAGTVLGFLALKEHSDYESRPSEAGADRGERLALFADVGFGVGAMAAVTAAVLYLTHDDVAPAPAPKDRPASARLAAGKLQFIPRLSANSASATARIRF